LCACACEQRAYVYISCESSVCRRFGATKLICQQEQQLEEILRNEAIQRDIKDKLARQRFERELTRELTKDCEKRMVSGSALPPPRRHDAATSL